MHLSADLLTKRESYFYLSENALSLKKIAVLFQTTCIIVLTIIFSAYEAQAQTKVEVNKGDKRDFMPLSPTAEAFHTYGDMKVNYFTGSPSINVPLYQLRYKELGVDLLLAYQNTAGNKPDAVPGYTGNGWLITTGGMITMLSRGMAPADIANPETILTSQHATNAADWSTTYRLEQNIYNKRFPFDVAGKRYDEMSYSFGGSSGKFYSDYPENDGVPSNTVTQHIKTAQGEYLKIDKITTTDYRKIKIPNENPGSPYYKDTIYQNTLTYKFIITDSKGVKYTFGGNDAAIEFTRSGMTSGAIDPREQNTVATSWLLTSIESPNGYAIRFVYKRGTYFITSTAACRGLFIYSNKDVTTSAGTDYAFEVNNIPNEKLVSSTLYHPCYLDSVVTPIAAVKFLWSKADKQLPYSFEGTTSMASSCYFNNYPQVATYDVSRKFSDKLDSFIVTSFAGERSKLVSFNYSQDTTTRLKLLSVSKQGRTADGGTEMYQFEYDTLKLPDYRSFKTDKYGYYNGRNLYITSSSPTYYANLFADSTQRADYLASREPDTTYTYAEILRKVVYPTSGSTTYEYEQNRYSKYVTAWPAAVELASDSLCGGLRVRKITNYDHAGTVAAEKAYFYRSDFASGGTSSSGVLNWKPVFFTSYSGPINNPQVSGIINSPIFTGATIDYTQWGTDPIYQPGTHKSGYITYSEVAEVNADNSFKVYTFKNYDNGYMDRPAENLVVDNPQIGNFWQEDEENSLDLERGQTLTELSYNAGQTLKKKVVYEYWDDTARFQQHVRMLKCYPNPFCSSNFPSLRYVAYLIYTYYPYLKKQSEYAFEGVDSIVTAVQYNYSDSDRLLTKQETFSAKDEVLSSIFQYPKDKVAAGDTIPYAEMMRRNMISPVVEKEEFRDDVKLKKLITAYAKGNAVNTSLILPSIIQTQYKANTPETRTEFLKYDTIGNPLRIRQSNGVINSYIWSYKFTYPIAEIINAPTDRVDTVLGGVSSVRAFANSVPSTSSVDSFLAPLYLNTSLPGSMATTYAYDLMDGMVKETNPNEFPTYYEYDALGRLSVVRDHQHNILKKICYNFADQQVACHEPLPVVPMQCLYFSSRILACNYEEETPLNQMLYTRAFDIDLVPDTSGNRLAYISYYEDAACTIPAATGYYLPVSGLSGPVMFIENGTLIYEQFCSSGQDVYLYKFVGEYSDTLCYGATQTIALFNDQLHISDSVYVAGPLYIQLTARNGYYISGNQIIHVVNGRVIDTYGCDDNPGLQHFVWGIYDPGSGCDILFPLIDGYCNGPLQTGTMVYSDSAMLTPLADETYTDGSSRYTIVNGEVTSIVPCVTAQHVLLGIYDPGPSKCMVIKYIDGYYTGSLGMGTLIYADSGLSIPLGDETYTDGTTRYTVSNGEIISVTACTP